jgi:ATP-binding cassette, subfamily B, bacterial HlyB/CyaB
MNQPDRRMPSYHTALRSLFLVALHHGCQIQPEQLGLGGDPADPLGSVKRVMREAGLSSRVIRHCKWESLGRLGGAYPAMAIQKAGNWVILTQVVKAADGEMVAVVDPLNEHAGVMLVPKDVFLADWSGTIVLCKRRPAETETSQPFGFRWFIPEIMRHSHLLRDVAIAAMMCNVISFAIPLLYHVIIDKVVPHQNYQTLYVVMIIFMVVTVFDGLFSYVRHYLMLIASNKIDARLNSRTFQHLLGLPLQFFEQTPAGVLSRHMQQTEKIRQFLTGRLFQTLLDCAALPILLVMLTLYSGRLTLVVLGFSLAMAAVIGLLIPAFRYHLNMLYTAEGARQAHLIETLHGMRTVKSLCMETIQKTSWDTKVVGAVRRHGTVGRIGAVANVLISGLDKVMQISVLGLGAIHVFDGSMSIGALVAFNMLSSRVSGPLVQVVALINEYQETALSVKMLGTVMDHPPERDTNFKGSRPAVTGEIAFDNVTFRYAGAATPALDQVSFRVEEGQMIGIVGRSGSGKTTVTRLIQGIHTPQEGLIQLNGHDLRHMDLAHLRRSVGVVLQDNFLFRGTLRENIAASKPDAPLADVMEAARMAGAQEFIDRLPMSYDTFIEEGASNLSGGQRQRISIARALLMRPRLLIFDEATSALDPESEAIVQKNLGEIARGRTMIIVSHRLSSLVTSDAILVLDQGKVIDFAPHPTLLERCSIYAHLWQQQTHHIQYRASPTELLSA